MADANLLIVGDWHCYGCHQTFPSNSGEPHNCGLPKVKCAWPEACNSITTGAPMGVSQWLAHGREFGYAEYWGKKIQVESRRELIAEIREKVEGLKLRPDNSDIHESGRSMFNQALKAVVRIVDSLDNHE